MAMRILRTTANLVNLIFCIQLLLLPTRSFAQDYFRASEEKSKFSLKGSEYLSGQNYREAMMRVNLIGEVNKPGVHVVPANTKFSTLLSFAGGTTKEANIEEIVIKRQRTKDKYKVIKYDFEEFLEDEKEIDLSLSPNDMIYVPQKEKIISDNSVKVLTIVSTVLGIVVSSFIIDDRI